MTARLAERGVRAVWHPCTQMKRHEEELPFEIARARGAWLYAPNGDRYLDGISSWWVNLFGHSHPHIVAALRKQPEQLGRTMLAGLTHEPVVELSEKLSGLTGLGHAFYGSDGASATEIALKMSAHYWRNSGRPSKSRFVGIAGYHGETVGALAVPDIALFREAYAPLVRVAAVVPSPDSRTAMPGQSAIEVAHNAAAALEVWLRHNHSTTAALIVEPVVQCAAGMAMHHPDFLRRARMLCDAYEVHLIADEIAVGFGRTGRLFAHQHAAIRPDFICLSKGLTGGILPLSVVLTTDAVYDALYADEVARAFLHSNSYSGKPLACRAALASLELFDSTNALARNLSLADSLKRVFEPLTRHPRVRHPRHIGMIWAWDIEDAPADFAQRYFREAMSRGLLLRPIGKTLYAMPPYVLDDEAIEHLGRTSMCALDATLAMEDA